MVVSSRFLVVIAAFVVAVGLMAAPPPRVAAAAEPVAVVERHVEVALVGVETVLADAVTAVVDAAKTVALILLSPVLVPLAFLSIGFTLGGTGICVSSGCEAEYQNPSWVAGKILKAVFSFLAPSYMAPAAVGVAPAPAAAAAAAQVAVAGGGSVVETAAVEPVAPFVERGRGSAETVERPVRGGHSVPVFRRGGTTPAAVVRPAAAATTGGAVEAPAGERSGKAGAAKISSSAGRSRR